VGAQRTDRTGTALLYRSADLVSWRFEGELSFPDAHGALDSLGYMWECPGIVRVPDEATGTEHDVLIFCPQGIRPDEEGYENIFPCVYTVGRLVGDELRECSGEIHEIDRGFEFYAPQVFARHPARPGPVLLMGWAGNAEEDDQPSADSAGWVHTMTVPRVLTLRDGRLVQRPATPLPDDAAELELAGAPVTGETRISELRGHRSWHLELEAEALETTGGSGRWGLRIGDEPCHVDIDLTLSASGTHLVVDRTTSRYARHGARRRVTASPSIRPRLEVLHDRSITEIVVGDGDIVFTLRSFVPPGSSGATVRTDGILRLRSARARPLD
jgi:beta-fructofuranosidase